MATTQNTLPYGTYANPTTPLWATALAGQQFVSPSEVTNAVVPPTAEITTFVNPDITGSFTLNTIPSGTPLNEIRLEGVTNGITLATNGEPTFSTAPNLTSVAGDLEIVSRQTGGAWLFNNNQLNYNGQKQITGDPSFTQIGDNTYSDSFGLNVWNTSSSNKTTTIDDRDMAFYTTTAGATTTNTYDFITPLIPNQVTADPLERTANPRDPIFPESAHFVPINASSSLVVSPSFPYSVSVTNVNPGFIQIGASLSKSSVPNDWIRGTDLPIVLEITMFDPGSQTYALFNQAGAFGQTNLLDEIKNVGGTLSFIPLGSSTPTTFVAGDDITIVYQINSAPLSQGRVLIAKNNLVISTAPVGINLLSAIIPQFFTLTAVSPGFSFTIPSYNWGSTQRFITSFSGWEWTTGLGGLYPRSNTGLSPTGAFPLSPLYDSVFLLGGCTMFSPPVVAGQGQTITISAFRGSKLGTGVLRVFQNDILLISTIVSNSWSSGTITTCVSTGNDVISFSYVSATDVLSLQRIQISYATTIDVLDGGVGMNGTNLNIGTGNFITTPDIQMTPSIINMNKAINMSNRNISNVGTMSVNTITYVGGGGEIRMNANVDMFNNSIGNSFEINTSNLRAVNIRNPYSASIVNVLTPLNMSNNNISNAGTIGAVQINSTNITNTSNITTASLNGTGTGATLDIGLSNATTNLWNVNTLTGRGSNFPALMSMVDTINQVSAIPTGVIYIQVNFDGFKQVCVPLVPTWNRSSTLCYPLTNPNYLSTDGYTLSGKSVLTIYDSFGIIISQHTNNGDTPRFYANGDLVLNSGAIEYTYRVNLPAL